MRLQRADAQVAHRKGPGGQRADDVGVLQHRVAVHHKVSVNRRVLPRQIGYRQIPHGQCAINDSVLVDVHALHRRAARDGQVSGQRQRRERQCSRHAQVAGDAQVLYRRAARDGQVAGQRQRRERQRSCHAEVASGVQVLHVHALRIRLQHPIVVQCHDELLCVVVGEVRRAQDDAVVEHRRLGHVDSRHVTADHHGVFKVNVEIPHAAQVAEDRAAQQHVVIADDTRVVHSAPQQHLLHIQRPPRADRPARLVADEHVLVPRRLVPREAAQGNVVLAPRSQERAGAECQGTVGVHAICRPLAHGDVSVARHVEVAGLRAALFAEVHVPGAARAVARQPAAHQAARAKVQPPRLETDEHVVPFAGRFQPGPRADEDVVFMGPGVLLVPGPVADVDVAIPGPARADPDGHVLFKHPLKRYR